jgi:hypothetical protein
MNDIQRSVYKLGDTAPATVRKIIERRSPLVTEGQIETAGKAYVKASVWTMVAEAIIDGARLVGRTVWILATYAAVIAAGVWAFKHWDAIMRWL